MDSEAQESKTVNPAGGRNHIWVSAATTNQNTVPISGTMGANSGKEQVNMKRMTTDNPQLNIERLLNTARAENNQAVLHLGDEVITLAEYVAKCAKETGCDVTLESVMDGDNCCECDCPVAILNILGIQAAENNARLKMIEKILGNDYDLDRLRELVQADREGRCVVLPCHIGDPVFMGMGRSKITGYEEDICDGFYIGRDGVLQVKSQCLKGNHGTYGVIGQSAELTSEAAKAALEKMKEREKDG